MEREVLIDKLKEQGYPQHMYENTILKLGKLQPIIRDEFNKWLITTKTPVIEIEGYSYTKLTDEYGMKPIGAFLTLDWLVRDPEKARKSLLSGYK